jgi:hypothetical protein
MYLDKALRAPGGLEPPYASLPLMRRLMRFSARLVSGTDAAGERGRGITHLFRGDVAAAHWVMMIRGRPRPHVIDAPSSGQRRTNIRTCSTSAPQYEIISFGTAGTVRVAQLLIQHPIRPVGSIEIERSWHSG